MRRMADQESASAEKAKRTVARAKTWWLSSTGSREATTSTSSRPGSSATSTECCASYIERSRPLNCVGGRNKGPSENWRRAPKQRRPLPKDGAALKKGERQGERGQPPGWALAPQQARSHWKWRQSPRGGGPSARMGAGSLSAARLQPLKGGRSQSRKALALDPSVLS